MSIELDDFLEHHGVKGQKWGIRNQYGEPLLSKRRKAFIKGVGTGIGVGIAASGAVYANHYLKKHGGVYVKVSTINKASKNRLIFGTASAITGAAITQQILQNRGHKDLNYITASG